MRLALYRNYREEQQPSMRIYADMLARHLPHEGVLVDEVRPREFLPEAARRFRRTTKWSDFIGRYLLYPLTARARAADVHHVIDHGSSHVLLGLPPDRSVVTCHDLVPLLTHRGRLPRAHVPLGARAIFRAVVKLLSRARLVITVSASTARDLQREVGCAPERIRIVPLGLQDEHLKAYDDQTLLDAEVRLRLGPRPRLLSVGGNWPHKNPRGILEAFARVRARHPRAVLIRVGAPIPLAERALARQLGVLDHVHELGRISVTDLACLYRICDVLLFPSFYEGFGWPPLEAMIAGLPVVASPSGSIPEVSGDVPLYADPEDYDGLGAAACRFLEDAALREARRAAGRQRAAQFTWRQTAARTAAVYAEVLR